ncbi:MAG: hypothetical protein M3Q07_25945 [Pseudobdellovibrionaceae bacterium]|nr:hypothetical protein [Pseudobdellovibrionaceae bacterium]
MKNYLIATKFLALVLATGCGSQSSKTQEQQNADAIPVTQAQQEEANLSENLLDCKPFHSDSVICSYKPGIDLIAEESTTPTLITVQYTLKCATGRDQELSSIALRTDSQVRRLQINVVDRKISILSRNGAVVDFAKVLKNDTTDDLKGVSSCWYLQAKVVKTEAFTGDLGSEASSL